jgi:hypothetical protein
MLAAAHLAAHSRVTRARRAPWCKPLPRLSGAAAVARRATLHGCTAASATRRVLMHADASGAHDAVFAAMGAAAAAAGAALLS